MFVTSSIPRQQPVVKSPSAANTAVLFGSPNKKKKADRPLPTETPSQAQSQKEAPEVAGGSDSSPVKPVAVKEESEDTFEWEKVPEDKERWNLEEVEKPDARELAQHEKDTERAKYEAIGRRLALPGQAISSVENQAKLMSRKLVGQTGDLVTNIRNSICQTTASALRKSAQTIENWQESFEYAKKTTDSTVLPPESPDTK